jgi:hypothetical protein
MNRGWTPESEVSFTDAGMVIEIKMKGINPFGLRPAFQKDQLCFRGEHEEFGPFEIKFEIPPGYNPGKPKWKLSKSVLHIEFPPGKKTSFFDDFPKSMLIYCNGCGKHFDIVITAMGPHDYTCPSCGKVQVFDLEALVKQVMEQSKKMSDKTPRRR